MNINILSNHKCFLSIHVEGNYVLTLNSVSGLYNPIVLDIDDWIKLEGDVIIKPMDRFINIGVFSLNDYLTDFGHGEFDTNIYIYILLIYNFVYHNISKKCVGLFIQI
jgi:hypothetical protein